MQHSLVSKLPKPSPLIVFIHGLGAQINQFEPLLKYFSQVADVLALDLPGCGRSPLVNRDWNFYTTEALATLVGKVIDLRLGGRKCILVGHSLGCFIAGRLALKLEEKCLAVVLLCPKAQISEKEKKGLRFMTTLPEFVFNILRKQDRRYASIFETVGLFL
jgi:pimeloyl-ACP methyl ester carboxylesterase